MVRIEHDVQWVFGIDCFWAMGKVRYSVVTVNVEEGVSDCGWQKYFFHYG